jgi:ABC-type sugar transport system permease subunit
MTTSRARTAPPQQPGHSTRTASVRSGLARRRGRGSETRLAYVFLAPLLAIFAGFYLWPAVATFLSSFFTWGMLNPWRADQPDTWVPAGLDNYTGTLASADFWNAALNSVVWLVVFPVLVVAISLALSLLIWEAKKGTGFFRSAIILPMTISLAAVGVIWGFIYNPDPNKGLLNAGLKLLGIGNADLQLGPLELHLGRWLSNPGVLHLGGADIRLTNVMIIIPAVWAFVGFGVITFTAGLTSVPAELVEASRVDGASRWQTIRHVTLPSLRPSIIVVVVISIIFALRTFDIVFVTTGGGPAQDTEVLGLLLWQEAFQFLDSPKAGQAAAIAIIMSAVLIAAAMPFLRKNGNRP